MAKIGNLVCVVALLAAWGCGAFAAEPGNLKVNRILFLGNSITRHGPKEAIGWNGNWGMAASSLDKDYVHILLRSLAEITGSTPEFMTEGITISRSITTPGRWTSG